MGSSPSRATPGLAPRSSVRREADQDAGEDPVRSARAPSPSRAQRALNAPLPAPGRFRYGLLQQRVPRPDTRVVTVPRSLGLSEPEGPDSPRRHCSGRTSPHNPEVQIMDLIPNSALDPVPDGLPVDLQDRGDLGHGHEVIGVGHRAKATRSLANAVSQAGDPRLSGWCQQRQRARRSGPSSRVTNASGWIAAMLLRCDHRSFVA
jgi:hypothetical protein